MPAWRPKPMDACWLRAPMCIEERGNTLTRPPPLRGETLSSTDISYLAQENRVVVRGLAARS